MEETNKSIDSIVNWFINWTNGVRVHVDDQIKLTLKFTEEYKIRIN